MQVFENQVLEALVRDRTTRGPRETARAGGAGGAGANTCEVEMSWLVLFVLDASIKTNKIKEPNKSKQ